VKGPLSYVINYNCKIKKDFKSQYVWPGSRYFKASSSNFFRSPFGCEALPPTISNSLFLNLPSPSLILSNAFYPLEAISYESLYNSRTVFLFNSYVFKLGIYI